MHYAVTEFGELSAVPTTGGSYQVSSNTLELVDVMASAVRTFYKTFLGILESAVHAAVAVVVH